MAEALSVVGILVSLVQTFNLAVSSTNDISVSSVEHRRLLNEYAVHMHVLENCISIIKTCREGPHLIAVLDVAKQCAETGQELAQRNSKVVGENGKPRTVFLLASFDKLRDLLAVFRFYVSSLQQLVQRLV